MPGFVEGGIAVLYAVTIYAAFFAVAGEQLRRAVAADEGAGVRVFYSIAVVVLSSIVWVIVGAAVYWGILLWFGFLLQESRPWHKQILSLTGWFPSGLLVATEQLPQEGGRAIAILIGYPSVLALAAGVAALWRRVWRGRDERDERATGGIVSALGGRTRKAED